MKTAVLITAVATSIFWAAVITLISVLHLRSEKDVLVIQQHERDGSYVWMSKAYLEKQQQRSRHKIPVQRVLVMFE